MAVEWAPAFSEFRAGETGHAYNEAAFRHFLTIDRRRAAHANRALLLVLVKLQSREHRTLPLNGQTAAALFAALGTCIREIDFVGWYLEGRVAAAVMTQRAPATAEVLQRVSERTRAALAERLPAHENQLRVRLVRLGCRS